VSGDVPKTQHPSAQLVDASRAIPLRAQSRWGTVNAQVAAHHRVHASVENDGPALGLVEKNGRPEKDSSAAVELLFQMKLETGSRVPSVLQSFG
jgi:hypothetical protein